MDASVQRTEERVSALEPHRVRRDPLDAVLANEQRVTRLHLGSALRHSRAALSLSLDGASPAQIGHEAGLALDSLGMIVWTNEGADDE